MPSRAEAGLAFMNSKSANDRLQSRVRSEPEPVPPIHPLIPSRAKVFTAPNTAVNRAGQFLERSSKWPKSQLRADYPNNAAERSFRGFALGRKAWFFAGSERGADRAAAMAALINTAKLKDINPQAWLADVLARIAGHPACRLHELLPWEWKSVAVQLTDAA